MKIIVDKINGHDGHALSKADVRLIFSTVLPAWSAQVKVVRLSASRPAGAAVLFTGADKTLTIASRGLEQATALRLVLLELAAHALGFKQHAFEDLQARHRAVAEALVTPLVAELLPLLSGRTSAWQRKRSWELS